MYKFLQNLFIALYRTVAVSVLFVIIAGVLTFMAGLVFYGVNRSWALPTILTPTHQRVLQFQPQIANLVATLGKQRVELQVVQSRIALGNKAVSELTSILVRAESAKSTESKETNKALANIQELMQPRGLRFQTRTKDVADLNRLLQHVDEELLAHLITQDQAIARRATLRSQIQALQDQESNQALVQEQLRIMQAQASTLAGGSSSITGVRAVQELHELKTSIEQAKATLISDKLAETQLRASIDELEHVIQVAQQSPYFHAVREPVTVMFVEYNNARAKVGAPIFDCLLQVLWCREIGRITSVMEAEEYAKHPLFHTDMRGRFVGTTLKPSESTSMVLFLERPPLGI